jgi:hypothetical protein
MLHLFAMFFTFVVVLAGITIPPAAKILAVVAVVYPLVQMLKKAPPLARYIKGWVAIALNIALSAGGLLIAIPADQLYTTNTLIALFQVVLGAAGVHGTVNAFMPSDPCPNCGHLPDQPAAPTTNGQNGGPALQ